MAYYNVCPKCGCNLDPGEKCDCESLKIEHQETMNQPKHRIQHCLQKQKHQRSRKKLKLIQQRIQLFLPDAVSLL